MTAQDVPILLVVFRRPDETRRVWDVIRRLEPRRLFVAADGPVSDADRDTCERTRAVVADVTWNCDVTRDYSDGNLGVDKRVPSAITAAFERVDRLIVFEDDCLPADDFFPFCAELLDRYADDARVMHISGECYRHARMPSSYYFSKYALPWGWATWRRAWRAFDWRLSSWPHVRKSTEYAALFDSRDERRYWDAVFSRSYEDALRGHAGPWDYAWTYACMTHGLAAHAGANLISNIGYSPQATHTHGAGPLANRPHERLQWPLQHPPVSRDRQADVNVFDDRYPGGILKHQRTLKHQLGRPWRWASRRLRRR